MAPAIIRIATHKASYGSLINALTWTEAAVCAVLLVGRFYTSWRITRRLRADFHLAVFTFVIALIAQILNSISIHHGLGSHINTLTHEQTVLALKYSWITQILLIVCMTFGKIAIVAFLLQIRGPHDPRPCLLYGIATTQTIVMIIAFITIPLQCSPMSKLWDGTVPGTCDGIVRNQHFAYFQGSWAALADLLLALYPITVIWKVKVDLHIRVGLCILMGLGVIAAICAAIRTSELTTLSNTDDMTYYFSPLIIWTSTEAWIILIVGCVPPIRPLFVQIFKAAKTVTSSSRSRTQDKSELTWGTSTIRSDSPEFQFKPLPHIRNDTVIGDLEGRQSPFGNKSSVVRWVDSPTESENSHEARGREVRVTTKVDVEYDYRGPRTFYQERDT